MRISFAQTAEMCLACVAISFPESSLPLSSGRAANGNEDSGNEIACVAEQALSKIERELEARARRRKRASSSSLRLSFLALYFTQRLYFTGQRFQWFIGITTDKTFGSLMSDGYAMLLRPNRAETAVHGCHCSGDFAVHMRKVMAIPRSWCSGVLSAVYSFLYCI